MKKNTHTKQTQYHNTWNSYVSCNENYALEWVTDNLRFTGRNMTKKYDKELLFQTCCKLPMFIVTVICTKLFKNIAYINKSDIKWPYARGNNCFLWKFSRTAQQSVDTIMTVTACPPIQEWEALQANCPHIHFDSTTLGFMVETLLRVKFILIHKAKYNGRF